MWIGLILTLRPNYTVMKSWHLHFLLFQSALVCSFPLDALPCEEAPNFFEGPESINARFGEVIGSEE